VPGLQVALAANRLDEGCELFVMNEIPRAAVLRGCALVGVVFEEALRQVRRQAV